MQIYDLIMSDDQRRKLDDFYRSHNYYEYLVMENRPDAVVIGWKNGCAYQIMLVIKD